MNTSNQVSDPTKTIAQKIQEAHSGAQKLAPNTCQVWPGGAIFTSIQDAINSCSGATPDEQYQVIVGPGTYNGVISLNANIYMTGAGQDKTILQNSATTGAAGTLMVGGNCGASMMTINCTGVQNAGYCTALYSQIDGTFMGAGLTLNATDAGFPNIVVAPVSNLAGSEAAVFELSNCTITATATAAGSTAMGIQIMAPKSTLQIELSTITATGTNATGIITASQASAVVEDCTVTGTEYSLDNDDQQSPITANGCTLNGPVTPGVTVNP